MLSVCLYVFQHKNDKSVLLRQICQKLQKNV